jgi:hypothetical protein
VKRNHNNIIALHEYKSLYFSIPKVAFSGLKSICVDLLHINLPDNAWNSELFHTTKYDHLVNKKEILILELDRMIAAKACPERLLVVAMIVARVIAPRSKLATARGLGHDTVATSLAEELGLEDVDATALYAAMDWLYARQAHLEKKLAKKHRSHGTLVLYDVTSTSFEGHQCSLAKRGYGRDKKKGKVQIVCGPLCNQEGCPIAIEVF